MEQEVKQLWAQAVERIENMILSGNLSEGDRAPSKNELSVTLKINPVTALRAISYLEELGVLYTKRGIGTFVCDGAKRIIYDRRKRQDIELTVDRLLEQADRLSITDDELIQLIKERRSTQNKNAK